MWALIILTEVIWPQLSPLQRRLGGAATCTLFRTPPERSNIFSFQERVKRPGRDSIKLITSNWGKLDLAQIKAAN